MGELPLTLTTVIAVTMAPWISPRRLFLPEIKAARIAMNLITMRAAGYAGG
ncbi:hypothetical protein [Lonsdalea quercina]|uniref:hypothetical protein n=1 Tax=Lonsdalea quercina TaxID=71657 RepID=UPI00397647E6